MSSGNDTSEISNAPDTMIANRTTLAPAQPIVDLSGSARIADQPKKLKKMKTPETPPPAATPEFHQKPGKTSGGKDEPAHLNLGASAVLNF